MDIDKKMPGMRKFRESFRGYRKEDVNAYLEQMYLQLNKKAEETPRKLAASSDIDLARSEETEKLKKEIGCVFDPDPSVTATVKGRNLLTGYPQQRYFITVL